MLFFKLDLCKCMIFLSLINVQNNGCIWVENEDVEFTSTLQFGVLIYQNTAEIQLQIQIGIKFDDVLQKQHEISKSS